MRKTVIITCMTLTIGILLAVFFWSGYQNSLRQSIIDKEVEAKEFQEAQNLMNQNQVKDALKIIYKYDKELSKKTEGGEKWRSLFIEASTQTNNIAPLNILYEYFPGSFLNQEKASIVVGSSLLLDGKISEYEKLRNNWSRREKDKDEWLMLDADKLIIENKPADAAKLLNSFTIDGKDDSIRLMKLAMIYVYDDPRKAWEYFNEAYLKNPENPTVRSYRGKLLEVVGRNNLALGEYLAAVQADPKNLFLQDQLGEFYLRNGDYHLALDTFANALTPPSKDFIWLKAIFWNRVITPLKFDWKATSPPNGSLKPLLEYLINLPTDKFWDTTLFEKISNGQIYLNNIQSTFWLRLLQNLKEENETAALELIRYSSFNANIWDPQLELALKRILNFRKNGSLAVDSNPGDSFPDKKPSENKQRAVAYSIAPANGSSDHFASSSILEVEHTHSFFQQLEHYAKNSSDPVPDDLKELLHSKEVFAATLIAASWFEAGLQLHTLSTIPANFPDWVAYGITQALRTNRGDLEALKFAKNQKETSVLTLLIGELLLSSGSSDAALDELKKVAEENSEIGSRATWLISLIYFDQGRNEEAKKVILAQPTLSKSVLGLETLAKIAIKEGNVDEAEKIYRSIKDKSTEAKSYFAQKAFIDKDYPKAKKITEELLQEDPFNANLQENYQKILKKMPSAAPKNIKSDAINTINSNNE